MKAETRVCLITEKLNRFRLLLECIMYAENTIPEIKYSILWCHSLGSLSEKNGSLKIICATIMEENRIIITIKNQLIKTCELF